MSRNKIITNPKLAKAANAFGTALESAICWVVFLSRKRKGKPGEIIEKLNPEQRKYLKYFTSDLIQNVNKDLLYNDEYEKKKELSKMKENVDKKFKKRI